MPSTRTKNAAFYSVILSIERVMFISIVAFLSCPIHHRTFYRCLLSYCGIFVCVDFNGIMGNDTIFFSSDGVRSFWIISIAFALVLETCTFPLKETIARLFLFTNDFLSWDQNHLTFDEWNEWIVNWIFRWGTSTCLHGSRVWGQLIALIIVLLWQFSRGKKRTSGCQINLFSCADTQTLTNENQMSKLWTIELILNDGAFHLH